MNLLKVPLIWNEDEREQPWEVEEASEVALPDAQRDALPDAWLVQI